MGDDSLVESGVGTSLLTFDFLYILAVLPLLGELESSPTTFHHSLLLSLSIWDPVLLP
jgi:hypothetical protein